MKFSFFFTVIGMLILGSLTWAQTKVSGITNCAKPDIQQQAEVGDHPGHMIGLSQSKCTWTKPLEIAGVQDKEGMTTGIADIHGNTAHGHGYFIDSFTDGSKTFIRFQGTDTLKDGKPQSEQGEWNFTGGTGKLEGIKGHGTYKGTPHDDGSVEYAVEGEYQLSK
jgi:hypothetical protein